MIVRPKTVRRLLILAAAFVLIIGALATIWFVHQRNKEKRLLADRDFGIAAFRAGDWQLALARLGPYKDAHPEDFDTLYAYAVSRSRVPTSNGRHLVQAKQLFEQLTHARPDDLKAAHALLELYLRFSYNREAIDLADSILAKHPADVEALRAKSLALRANARLDEALTVSEKLNEVAPLDLGGHRQTFDLLGLLKRPAPEVLARYESLLKTHPDDPRFEVLLALASDYARDRAATLKWLRTAAKRPAPDASFVEQLSQLFDRLGLFDESQALLERAVASGGADNSAVLTVLVQRLWQNGRYADVVARLKDLDPARPSTPAELAALKAMALFQLKKPDDAGAIVKALDARKNDAASQAWALALHTRYDSKLEPRAAIASYEKALARDRDNAIIRSWIADTYLRLGEIELALGQWRAAANLMPSWSEPFEMISRALLSQGRELPALDAARAAGRRAPTQISPAVTMALAWNAYLQDNPIPQDEQRLLVLVQQIQKRVPGEPLTLPIYCALQAKLGRQDLAIAAIENALKLPTTTPETLVKLLAISRANNLGIDSMIAAKIGSGERESPALAYAHATELARAGKSAQGLESLSAAAKVATTQPAQWQLATARYRDAINDPGAKDAWVALGDANPGDVNIQSAILTYARAARVDREFMQRSIERARKLTGDDGQLWRVAKARWLLSGPNKVKDSNEAVTLMSDLVRASPDVAQYRLLLAAGLKNLGNTKDATDHLKAAVSLEPGDITTVLDLARLLQMQGKFDEALDYLSSAAKNEDLSPANRTMLARIMAQQGATLAALDALKASGQLDPSGMLLMADLARARGQVDEAASLYEKLLADPKASADAIAAAADFLASRGKLEQAQAAIARLNDAPISVWQKLLLQARFEEAHGKGAEAARTQFVAATEAASGEATAWRALCEFELRQSRWDAAMAAADRGLTKAPGDVELKDLKLRIAVLSAAANEKSDLGPMIAALSKDPSAAAQADLLRAVQATRTLKGEPDQIIEQVRPLAEKHPTNFALQSMLVRQYVSAGRDNDAANIAERLLQARPNDSAPAELATGVYQAAGRWRDMKRSADIWHDRTLASPLAADLAGGEALLHLKDPKAALDRLSPYLAQVQANPAGNPPLTAMLLRAMIGSGKSDDARALLQPLLAQSPAWRQLWLSLASEFNDATAATQWIKSIASQVPTDAPSEQLALARAWQLVYVRYRTPDAAAAERQILQKLCEAPQPEPAALVMLGSLDVDARDYPAAEKLYRRALEIRPDIPEAQNNLAYILLDGGQNLDEALALARRAVTLAPNVADFHDTLARIQIKQGARADGIKSFELALKLDSRNLQSMIGLASALSADGRRSQAAELLRRIDAMLNGVPPSNEALKSELQGLRDQLSRTTG